MISDIGDNTKEFVFEFSKLKGRVETEEFDNGGILFKFSFKSTFKSDNNFFIQVTSFSETFGILELVVFNEMRPEKSPTFRKKMNINLNTPTPCKFKIKFSEVHKYVNNNELKRKKK